MAEVWLRPRKYESAWERHYLSPQLVAQGQRSQLRMHCSLAQRLKQQA